MTQTLRQTFVRHQLEAVADDLAEDYPPGKRLNVEPRARVLWPAYAAGGHLIHQFLDALDAGLPLCGHVTAPGRTAWTPGMPNFGCALELIAYPAVTDDALNYCNLCGAPAGELGFTPVLVVAGPVLINGAVCPRDCLHQRSLTPYDVTEVRRCALELVTARFCPPLEAS